MALRLGPRGTGEGECCECEEFTGCDCNGPDCSLICESKEVTAEVCGFGEFADVSTPPRVYKVKSFAGAADWTIRLTNCSGTIRCEYTDTLGGSITKDPDDSCSESGTGTRTRSAVEGAPGSGTASGTGVINGSPGTWSIEYTVTKDGGGNFILNYTTTATGGGIYLSAQFCCGSGPNGLLPDGATLVADMEVVAIYTHAGNILVLDVPLVIYRRETCASGVENITSLDDYSEIGRFDITDARIQRTAEPSGAACQVSGGEGQEITNSPTLTETLSDEDTEDDAEDRAAAAVGSWTACSSPCVCEELTAYRQDRGSGFSWTARVVRVKVHATNLAESSSYQATIQYQRRPYGSSDPWVDFAQEFVNLFTGASETEATSADWVEVPNTRGFETRARCAGVVLL